MTTDIEQERAEFEAWAKAELHLQRGLNGDYRAMITQIAWTCWQEAYQAGRAALQSQPVNEGWKEAAIAWEVCASIHRQYCKGKDPFFKTRQADFVRHAADSRDREDAENYRWIKEHGLVSFPKVRDWMTVRIVHPMPECIDSLDKAIDHARRIEGDGE